MLIQKYLSKNMSYRKIAHKTRIAKSAVFSEIKTKSINGIYAQYFADMKKTTQKNKQSSICI